MERKDEFNTLEVINEDQSSFYSYEYGKTQKSDFVSTPKDNKTSNSRDEINDNLISSSEHNDKEKDISDLLKDKVKSSETEASIQSEAAQSGQAAVETTATAGTSVSGTIVGASITAVATVAVVVGINVIANDKANVKLVEFEAAATEVYYGLQLFTDPEDTGEYYIHVQNADYSASRALQKGPRDEGESSDWPDFNPLEDGWYNGGEFTGLTPNTVYNIYVKDDSNPAGRMLFESTFTTLDGDVSEPYFNGIIFTDQDYLNNKLKYKLDMYDPTGETYSNIQFDLYNGQKEKIFDLPNDDLEHEIDLSNEVVRDDTGAPFDLMYDTFSYVLSFDMNGEPQESFSETGIDFNGGGTMHSAIGGVSVSETANFLTYEFYVTLEDFSDDFNIIDNIQLEISDDDHVSGHTYTLEPTSEPQLLCGIVDEEVVVDVRTMAFITTLTYDLRGSGCRVESEENFMFEDNSGSVNTFNSITFSEPNYSDNTFYATLDYEEDIEGALSFNLEVSNGQITRYTTLQHTKEPQLVTFDGVDPDDPTFDLTTDTLSYALTYEEFYRYNEDNLVEGSFDFNGGGTYRSEILGITFSETANYMTYEFTVTLSYVDDFNFIDTDFIKLSMTGTQGDFYEFDLELTEEEQTLSGKQEGEVVLDIRHESFTWVLNYYVNGDLFTMQNEPNEQVAFTDNSGAEASFNGVTMPTVANYESYEFDIALDFEDPLDEYSNFEITFNNYYGGDPYTVGLNPTTSTQTICGLQASEEPGEEPVVVMDVREGKFSYILTYYYNGIEQTYSDNKYYEFDRSDGVAAPTASIYIEESVAFSEYNTNYTTVTVNTTNDTYEMLSGFMLTMTPIVEDGASADEPESIEFELSGENGVPQEIYFDTPFSQCSDYTYELTYMYKSNEYTDSGEVHFVDNRRTQFNALVTNDTVYKLSMASNNYYLPIRYDYVDDFSLYRNSRMYVDGELVDSISLQHEWQFIQFDANNVSTDTPITIQVQIYIYDETLEESTWTTVVEEEHTLTYSSESYFFVDATIDSPASVMTDEMGSFYYFQYIYILFWDDAQSPNYDNWYVTFTDLGYRAGSSTSIDVDFPYSPTPSSYSASQVELYLDAYPDLISLISDGHRFMLTLHYTDTSTGESHEVTLADSVVITFNIQV